LLEDLDFVDELLLLFILKKGLFDDLHCSQIP
jgi:hypothetical protein